MASRTIIDNASGSLEFSGGQIALPAPTEQGQVLVANSAGAWTPYTWNPTFKNRIINGDMRVAQRGTAAVTSHNSYPVDQWFVSSVNDGAFSAQQTTDAPPGFTTSLKWTTTTADGSLSSSQYAMIRNKMEGFTTADLSLGTTNAKTITVSFWVKSSLTGTFGGVLRNYDASRAYPYTYTISAASTWEKKTFTLTGDQTGAWLSNNGTGLELIVSMGAGSAYVSAPNIWTAGNLISATGTVSVIGVLNATFYLTGVQLELGSVATAFETRPMQTELALCQRYYQRLNGVTDAYFATGVAISSTTFRVYAPYVQTFRALPTLSVASVGCGEYGIDKRAATLSTVYYGVNSLAADFASTSMTAGRPVALYATNDNAYIDFSAEL